MCDRTQYCCMKARKKGSLSYYTLLVLEKSIDGYVKFDDFIHNPGFYAYGMDREPKKSDLAQALKRLREQGLIKQDNLDTQEIVLKLTDSGREVISGSIIEFEQPNWDGKWRIVIFDIPEEKRVIRNLFRRNLKKWGFKKLQKSVWISKMDIYERLENYVKDLGIERWVTIIEANKLTSSQ